MFGKIQARAIERFFAQLCLFLLAAGYSPLGAQTPPTLVLMHSHMGIRIEYDIGAQRLNLWISPSPTSSIDYHDRNFSNRDDHTSLFDSISFPSLKLEDFLGCDYDAFHSVLHFKNQTLHLASLYDRPVVLLWFEKPGQVDIKTDKSSRILEQSPSIFSVQQTDRGKDLAFVAAIAPGAGAFTHQLVLDEGRSTYARADLQAGQPLFFAGGLSTENLPVLAQPLSAQPLDKILSGNEALIAEALSHGNLRLRNLPELQKLIDINKRFLLSMQDPEGAQRDTAKSIYYLIWVRNGGMTYPPLAAAGWVDPLRRWNRFELANPTVIENEEPRGRMFGQLVNGKINKWEEDGTYYAILSAFSYWTQTGDQSYLSGENLALLEDSMDWVERRCFDPSKGLFGRYYHSESPLYASRDYGWDNAVGVPGQQWPIAYHGETIRRSYDLYINLLSYSSYLMLSAAEQGGKAETYRRKAEALAAKMQPWLDEKHDGLPAFGTLISKDNRPIPAGPYGQVDPRDVADYEWALSLPPFTPRPWETDQIHTALLRHMQANPGGYYLAAYFSILTSLDTDVTDEREIMNLIDYASTQSYPAGKYLPMPYAMKEMSDAIDGDHYHDIRPETFTSGPWYGTMAAFGVRKLPFGIAVRPTRYLDRIEKYEYQGSLIDISFEGVGPLESVTVNGQILLNTLQIPENALHHGENTLRVRMGTPTTSEPLLVSSTVRLLAVTRTRKIVTYKLETYGKNLLIFRNLSSPPRILGPDGKPVRYERHDQDGRTYMEFEGRGAMQAVL
ncbi:MAG: hypothetical protein ABSF16_14130 [Terracidiphilus sp.]